jgi:LemA protein
MSAGKIFLIIAGAFALLAVILALWVAGIFNGLVTLEQGTDRTWADVQNDYQRRTDLVPNLVNTVSGAANFEKSTLTEITAARASVGKVTMQMPANGAPTDPAQLAAFESAQAQMGGALSHLLAVAENYPTLKATTGFLALQAQLEGTENRIAVARGDFNAAVQAYDTAIARFPAVLFASAFGHKERPYFTAVAGSDKPPTVQFDFGGKTAPATP